MGEESLQIEPIAAEEETLKLLPKSFRPFKSNEEYLQVSPPVEALVRRIGSLGRSVGRLGTV